MKLNWVPNSIYGYGYAEGARARHGPCSLEACREDHSYFYTIREHGLLISESTSYNSLKGAKRGANAALQRHLKETT